MTLKIVKHPAAGTARANVLITHGYAEHWRRYWPLVREFTAAGYTVWTYDQRGHGDSAGPRALVDVAELVGDHRRVRARVRAAGEELPLVLVGHSMGGLVTAASTLQDPAAVDAVVLSGPALEIIRRQSGPRPARALLRAVVLAAARLDGRVPVAASDPSILTNKPGTAEQVLEDPLFYTGPTRAKTAASMLRMGEWVRANADSWKPPLLVVQGEEDQLVERDAVREFVATVAAQTEACVRYREYPGTGHEVFNDYIGPEAIAGVVDWVGEVIK